MNDPHLDQLETFVGQWRRGHLDGVEVLVDCLTNLRLFARVHALDFGDALRVSGDHYEVEARPLEVVQVGLDGHSRPMLRFVEDMPLPDHLRRVASEADLVAWREWGAAVAGV